MDHPVLNLIRRESFTPLGWFAPQPEDGMAAAFVILIGNAGPDMFRRFARERNPLVDSMDDWTRATVDPLAKQLDAQAVYPFDKPAQPFLTWARKGGAGHTSPLGLNIHPQYGLWHAYRAALLFPVVFDIPRLKQGTHPCDSCSDKPCLAACPVSAFDGQSYAYKTCGKHILSTTGEDCMTQGCKARNACPVGTHFRYHPLQIQFHMRAFQTARARDAT
jgi:epoxyqueuosine reductase QueG